MTNTPNTTLGQRPASPHRERALAAALNEALDQWHGWIESESAEGDPAFARIAELRALAAGRHDASATSPAAELANLRSGVAKLLGADESTDSLTLVEMLNARLHELASTADPSKG